MTRATLIRKMFNWDWLIVSEVSSIIIMQEVRWEAWWHAGSGVGRIAKSPTSCSSGNRKWTVSHKGCGLSIWAHPHSDALPPMRPHLLIRTLSICQTFSHMSLWWSHTYSNPPQRQNPSSQKQEKNHPKFETIMASSLKEKFLVLFPVHNNLELWQNVRGNSNKNEIKLLTYCSI